MQWEHPDAFDQRDVEDMPARHVTWQKDVDLHPPAPVKHLPRPTPSRSTPVLLKIVKSRRIRPALFFWISIAVISILDFSGAFGMLVVLGRGNAESISLRVTPDRVVVGATITLRGTHFSPHGRIGLTRDASLPMVDTGGSIIAATDGNGNFTDTVIVGGWGSGRHILSAEDAVTHKIASFSITVSNQGELLMPPHLEVAQRSVP